MLICPNTATCNNNGCPHHGPHESRLHCSGSYCPKAGRDVVCLPYKKPVTGSVVPSSTATKSSNNPPEGAKENTEMKNMNIIEKVTAATKKTVAQQPEIIKSAAILEAAEILTDKIVALAKPKLPMMVRGYADTPIFRAILANVALVGVETALPDVEDTDVRKQIAAAAAVNAYKEVIDSFNPGEILDGLFGGKDMQKLISKATTGKTGKAAAAKAAVSAE